MNDNEKRSLYLQGIKVGLRVAIETPDGKRAKTIRQELVRKFPVPNTERELRTEKDSKGIEWKFNPEHNTIYWLDEVGREEYKPVWRGIKEYPKQITTDHILLWGELLKNPYKEDEGYLILKKLKSDIEWALVETGFGKDVQ